jgi:hypothetical protein
MHPEWDTFSIQGHVTIVARFQLDEISKTSQEL